ncbi:MAG TPA: polymer-forming cytoskeletal protein [Candidatus Thermoplasmatota archaeon]|nr:polymer-forming cytoskeletal protein [Candidatus Thermoplasmatota archaeon]
MSGVKVHRMANAHVVHGEVDASVRAPGALVVAPGARIAGDIDARGEVHVARGAFVAGAIRAMGGVIVGAHARVVRGIRAEGAVTVQAGAIVSGEIDAAGDVRLTPGSRVDTLLVGGDLHVMQPVVAPKVRVRGRVHVEPREQ